MAHRVQHLVTWTNITSGFTQVLPETRDNDGIIFQSTAPVVVPALRTFYRVFVSIP
jgi:hypothetical protein